MAYHVGVLPDGQPSILATLLQVHDLWLCVDVLQTLVAKLNRDSAEEENSSEGLRFVRLPHPRTGIPSLFLPYQTPDDSKSSLLEVQAVSPPNPRSWFMSHGEILDGPWGCADCLLDGKLLVMTPIDPAFVLIPILQCIHPIDGTSNNFRTMEDILEEAAAKVAGKSSALDLKDPSAVCCVNDILHLLSFTCIQGAMKHLCEVKEITADIVVYRYTPAKVQDYLRLKVGRLASPEIFEGSRTLTRNLAKEGLMDDGKEALLESGRLRGACNLISHYISQELHTALLASYDFTALNAHLKAAEQVLVALTAENMNKAEKKENKIKNGGAAEKKRKGQKGSQGVEKLKKANVKGMAQISSFFQKSTK
ncbi:ribonuclease H2, subunit B [Sparassis latifolia]